MHRYHENKQVASILLESPGSSCYPSPKGTPSQCMNWWIQHGTTSYRDRIQMNSKELWKRKKRAKKNLLQWYHLLSSWNGIRVTWIWKNGYSRTCEIGRGRLSALLHIKTQYLYKNIYTVHIILSFLFGREERKIYTGYNINACLVCPTSIQKLYIKARDLQLISDCR